MCVKNPDRRFSAVGIRIETLESEKLPYGPHEAVDRFFIQPLLLRIPTKHMGE